MFRLNNRGQSLVLFIVLIPIFLLIMTLVYDIGNYVYEKNRLTNSVYMAISYGLDNIDEVTSVDVDNYIRSNIDDLMSLAVTIDDGVIEVYATRDIRGGIGMMFGFDFAKIECSYRGIMDNDKKVIERVV